MILQYPTASKLLAIEREKMPILTMGDPVFSEIMPVEDLDSHLLEWEQGDNFIGLQNLRGLGGEPVLVKATGSKKYAMTPGTYGEYMPIEEEELTKRRPLGDYNAGPINISKVVMERQEQLLSRRIDRLKYIAWNTAQGSFTVANGYNGAVHKDAFAITKYTASTPWATSATATPLSDFRNVRTLEAGRGVSFGSTAKAWMNLNTANALFSNTNTNDLAGRRTSGLNVVLNLDEINRVLLGEHLPQIAIYNETYFDDNGVLNYFIPNNKVIVKGTRRTGPSMKYFMTRNASNPNGEPGAYSRVVDYGAEKVPRRIEVHDGHNGGPAVFYPGDLVLMTI